MNRKNRDQKSCLSARSHENTIYHFRNNSVKTSSHEQIAGITKKNNPKFRVARHSIPRDLVIDVLLCYCLT